MSNPPFCNTGGTSRQGCSTSGPTQGPFSPSVAQKTIVDTISFSFGRRNQDDVLLAGQIIVGVTQIFPEGCNWGELEPGTQGYPYQQRLFKGSLVLGWLAFGARHGRPWLYITGAGLRVRREALLKDDDLVILLDLEGARLTRVDIALDLYSHEHFSVATSLELGQHGAYQLPKSPTKPSEQLIQSTTGIEAYPLARTHYIGKKSSGKRLRVYDKGLEQLHGLKPEQLEKHKRGEGKNLVRAAAVPEGCNFEEWTRVELEYTKDGGRILTPDMITDRDEYFAGSFPPCARLLGLSDGKRPKYIPLEEDITWARMAECCRTSYGGFILSCIEDRSMSDQEIVALIKGDKKSSRLMIDREPPSGGELDQ